jgi:hypothetical protein
MFTAQSAPTIEPTASTTSAQHPDRRAPVVDAASLPASASSGTEAAAPDFEARLDFPPPDGPPPSYDHARYEEAPSGNGAVPERRAAWLLDLKAPTRYRYYDGARWTEWVCSRHAGISVNHL